MRIIILLLLLLLIANSCRVIFDGYDPDPLYNRKYYIEPRGYARPIPRYIEPNPLHSPPGYYWYPGYIQRERVIIIKPQDKTNYGKRPSRDIGDYNPNFKPQRGRPN